MGHQPDSGQGGIRCVSGGVIRIIGLAQVPVQLRRNRQPFSEGVQPLEKLGPFLRGDRESNP
ncbi:MAG: hypothetical protein H8K07_21320 [Nitrospira sp.]|nr:hypothetical protein [Nitrospira sp.]MDI3463503.1 hypothetical protein [Nitrospira sp.]